MGPAAELEDGDRRIASGKSAAKNRVAQKKYRDRQKEKMKLFEGQVEQLSKRLALLETENTSLGDRNRMLERLAQIVDEAPAARHTGLIDRNDNWDNTTSVALARFLNVFRGNKQPLLTAKEAATLSMANIFAFKHEYVIILGGLLLLAGDDPRSEHLKKVEELVLEQRMARNDMVDSLSLRAVAQMMADKETQPVVVTGFKESVVTVMQLQPDQKRALLQAKAAAVAELKVISRDRAAITKEISRNEEASNPNGMCDAYIQGSAMATAMALEERFTESLATEHRVLMQFYRACSEATTPVQEARALVEAFPEWFDMWLLPSYFEAQQQGGLPEWIQQNCGPCERVPLHEPSSSASQADTCSAPSAMQQSAFQEAAGAPQQLPRSEASGDSTVLNDLDVQLETVPSLPEDFALGLDNSELFDFLSLPSHINVTS